MSPLTPKRILLISTSSGSRGGGEIALMQEAEALIAEGHHVQVLVSTNSRMNELVAQFSDSVPIVRKPFRNTYDKRLRFLSEICFKRDQSRLSEYIHQAAPDLIHLNKQNLEDGLDWLQVIEKMSIPSVVTIHVPNSMESLKAKFGRCRDYLLRPQFRNLRSTLVTVSEASKRKLEDFLGPEYGTKIEVITNGVPPVERIDGTRFRKEWTLPADAFVLGTIARIEVQKNPWFAVHLLQKLPARVHIVWVGDGRLRREIEELAEKLGVSSRFHIDGWRDDARDRLSAFDLFFLPSRFEGFPLAILEAMSAQLPCYVSDVDGNIESVVEGETGRILPLDDLDVWADAIAASLDQPQNLREMGTAGAARYAEHYSPQAMARKVANLYSRLLGEGVHA